MEISIETQSFAELQFVPLCGCSSCPFIKIIHGNIAIYIHRA